MNSSTEVATNLLSSESFDHVKNEIIDIDDMKSLSSKDSSVNTSSKGVSQVDKKSQVKQQHTGKSNRQHQVPTHSNGPYQNIPYCYRGMMPPPTHYPSQHMPYPYMMSTNSSGHMQYPPMFDPRNGRYITAAGSQMPVPIPNHPGYYVRAPYPNGNSQAPSRYPTNFQGVHGQPNPVGRESSAISNPANDIKSTKPSTGVSGQESNTRKRTVDGVIEQSQYPSNSTFTIRRSDSLSSTGSTTTSSLAIATDGGKFIRESPMKKDNVGGIAMMVSNDSKSFEVNGDGRSDSPSSASSLSLGGLSMASFERSRNLGSSSREYDAHEIIENTTKRPKPDFKNMNRTEISTMDEGKTPISKNTISLKEKQVSFDQASHDRDLWKIPTSVCANDKVDPLHHSITPAIIKNNSMPSSGSETDFSPTIDQSLSDLVPQLSWASMVGDSPPIDDIVKWAESDSKRNVTMDESPLSLDGSICPLEWKDGRVEQNPVNGGEKVHPQDDPMLQLPLWSPKSFGGSSPESLTPLPFFFGNNSSHEKKCNVDKEIGHHPTRADDKDKNQSITSNPLTPYSMAQMRPHLIESRDDTCAGRDDNRVRNLRGHVPMLSPFPIFHVTPSRFPSRNSDLISPMNQLGQPLPDHLWRSPNFAVHHRSQHPMMNSKRKCVPLKPPLPQKFQGDMEAMKSVPVPEFSSLVNFPSHMSQKQTVLLPAGMRCCVMCGFACPCSVTSKSKKASSNDRSSSMSSHSNIDATGPGYIPGYGTIPTQNKGLCTRCDVNVWVVVTSGLEIKWCKGCKNFRPWAAFGEKGLATKCVRCRERQREKYALQKEEKDKGASLDEDDM